MSKYRDALERILCEGIDEVVLENPTFENIKASCEKTSIAIEIIEEAIYKAEKYDNDNITYKKKFEAQLKYIAKLQKENQILKDGINLQWNIIAAVCYWEDNGRIIEDWESYRKYKLNDKEYELVNNLKSILEVD